jgi:peptide-methionine (S)-S-oxide reductase
METIILGGGCFWCLDAIFQRVIGVISVVSGYTGGEIKNPTYKEICTGRTGHVEVIKIEFDNKQITLLEILEIFWQTHNPTTLNRQGNDIGTQYRSAIYFIENSQEKIINQSTQNLKKLKLYQGLIITEIKRLDKFYIAEDYHQDYYNNNSIQPYCSLVINPKIKKFEKQFKNK